MKTKLIKQEGIGYNCKYGFDFYLKLNYKIYHTNPLTLGMLNIKDKGGGPLSYKNCYEIYLKNPNSNEWNIEIEMETKKQLVNGYENQPDNVVGFVAKYKHMLVPKLDADGCLILKQQEQ